MNGKGVLRARLGLALTFVLLAGHALAQGNYTLFESGPVRPLALSADGTKLFACNIPDGRLEVFDVSAAGLAHSGSVQVGVDPVAVAVAPNGQVWVVNHMSDSISIVDVPTLRVVRTLLVGDEPRDIVFAGAGGTRAFITTARRGQARYPEESGLPNDPVDPNAPYAPTDDLMQPGLGRADVWVFESTALGTSLGGDELAILTLFGDTPRALAKSPDGLTVYAAVFHSGNQTTAVTEGTPGITTPGPLPDADFLGGGTPLPAPQVGVMLRQIGPVTWEDVDGTDYNGLVQFSLPDNDVFAIDADASALDASAITDEIPHVGTVLFNMVVHPTTGTIYVSNTEANNMDRFEGSGPTTLRGELHRAQISLISGGVAQQRRLNPHIVYTNLNPAQSVNDRSLAIPTDMAISTDGSTLYVAAFGSRKVGFIDTAALALAPGSPGAYDPNTVDHVELSAGGPGGVVLDAANDKLYVLTRFDNAISIVDTNTRTETAHIPVHSPEAPSITNGRRFLYDSRFSSSNGEASCASCHVFGDFDSLAWDLGNGDAGALAARNNNRFVLLDAPFPPGFGFAGPNLGATGVGSNLDFHPLKGPMTTQTLRGMDHAGPMHWRGDRSGGTSQAAPGYQGTPGSLDETLAFQAFNPAFEGLLGRQSTIPAGDMLVFTNFILQVQLPPNPVRKFSRLLTGQQAAGLAFYNGPISDTLKNCNGCHTLSAAQGFFGTGGLSTFEGETQHFKVAHLRNDYAKVGMFGQVFQDGSGDGDPNAPQVRGFGYLHDGSIATVMNFLGSGSPMPVFQFPGGDPQRKQVTALIMAFDTDLAPLVGQQVTLTQVNAAQPDVTTRLSRLISGASTDYPDPDRPVNKECDLVVKGRIGGQPRGWWMSSPGQFTPDVDGAPAVTDATLRANANTAGQELTYTCVPPGSGTRLGIDRGGVGDGSQPDNIRDTSQCGDLNEDGVDTALDVGGMRGWLAGASTPNALEKCNVNGANGSAAANCTIVDVAALRRALAQLPPALTQGCVL